MKRSEKNQLKISFGRVEEIGIGRVALETHKGASDSQETGRSCSTSEESGLEGSQRLGRGWTYRC